MNPSTKTYSPCTECRRINRVPVSFQSAIPPQGKQKQPVCGYCKATLPFHGTYNTIGASDLLLLAEKSPIPVLAAFETSLTRGKDPIADEFMRIFEAVSEQLAGAVVFARVDLTNFPLAADTYGIHEIPTSIFFREGFERARFPGRRLPPQAFVAWLERLFAPPQEAAS